MASAILTQDRLRELLHYDPDTGVFTWLVNRPCHRGRIGDVAGAKNASHGYLSIGIDGQQWLAHRLAWLYVTGEQPPSLIDHKDRDKTNCRWSNLRPSSKVHNAQNTSQPHRGNSSGFLGVHAYPKNSRKPWVASIKPANAKRVHLGYFKTPEEAHAAYLEAKRRLHAGCTI